jgi:hypothetical protein
VLAAFIIRAVTHHSDAGGSKHLWNISKLLPDYMAQVSEWRCPSLSLCTLAHVCMTALLAGVLWTESQGQHNLGLVYSFLGLWHHVMTGWFSSAFALARDRLKL